VGSAIFAGLIVRPFAVVPLILFTPIAFYIHYKWDWRGFTIGILIILVFVAVASCFIPTL